MSATGARQQHKKRRSSQRSRSPSPGATKPVFISYARSTSAAQAEALHRALGNKAFLDKSDIELGTRFPKVLVDALLGSRVVVVFADEAYFQRWYCLGELRTALGPAAFDGESVARLDQQSVQHVIVVLPAGKTHAADIDHLPPVLASGNWPRADDPEQIVRLVEARLRTAKASLSQLYVEAGQTVESVERHLLEQTPRSLAGLRTYPTTIPPLLTTFVGRADDLWRIDFALFTLRGGATAAAPAASIEGGAGFGKSTLAREYLHRFGPMRFPGGLFWINAEEPLDAQFHGVLRALKGAAVPDLPDFQRERWDARKELEVALHAEAAKGAILWVVDNIPEGGASLREYCPALGKVTVLATSRRRLGAFEQSVRSLPLAVLDPESAIDLLGAGLTPAPSRSDCKAVVEWVGRLPVALVVLNASLQLKRLTLRELVVAARGHEGPANQLGREWKALPDKGAKGLRDSVDHAFGLSFDRLSPEAQKAARLVARLAPSAIPEELVQHLGFSADVRGDLVGTSFVGKVDKDSPAAQSTVSMFGTMHRVVADYLRGRSLNATEDVTRVVEAVTATLDAALEARDQWRVLMYCAPHAEHLFQLTRPSGGAVQVPSQVRASLAISLSSASRELGLREEALAAIQEAVEVYRLPAKARPEAFEPYLALSLNNLSSSLSDMGRREEALGAIEGAVEVYRRLAAARPEAFEPDLALSLNNLSSSLSDMGRREEALGAIEGAVEIRRRLAATRPEAFEPDLALSLNNLSNRLSDMRRREDALDAVVGAVEIRRRLAVARPKLFEPALTTSLSDFSDRLNDLGRHEEAAAIAQEAAEIRARHA